jgi:hypothetical protein
MYVVEYKCSETNIHNKTTKNLVCRPGGQDYPQIFHATSDMKVGKEIVVYKKIGKSNF